MLQTVKEEVLGYDSFVSTIKQIVKERMGEGYSIRIYKVMKNNSLELDSLVVLKEGKNFAPNIYLMPYYESYLEGTSVAELALRLCSIYEHCSVPVVEEEFSYSFEVMKPYIFYRLVSFDRNQKLLGQIPHTRYLDLAVTFHCLVRSDDEGIGTIRITNEHLNYWNITRKDLDSLAAGNTKRLFPATIKSMEEVLHGIFDQEGYEEEGSQVFDRGDRNPGFSLLPGQRRMYILTNKNGINGASCILYPEVIRNFANRMKSDLYILPSSIHEVILIPKEKELNIDTLREMVMEVNRTQVAREEILSDRVYLYTRKQDEITL